MFFSTTMSMAAENYMFVGVEMTRKQNKAKQHKKTGHGWKDCCNFNREIL